MSFVISRRHHVRFVRFVHVAERLSLCAHRIYSVARVRVRGRAISTLVPCV